MPHQALPMACHAAAIAAVLLAVTTAPALHAGLTTTDDPAALPGPAGLEDLPELAALTVHRLLLADAVAAAEYGTPAASTSTPTTSTPTTSTADDLTAEHELFDAVTEHSVEIGLPAPTGVWFFRAQLEAANLVRRGLHARWQAEPALRPQPR
ncbi:hypothetical protein ABZW11_37655, partial [Nonomuraea sp. NPDC004580]